MRGQGGSRGDNLSDHAVRNNEILCFLSAEKCIGQPNSVGQRSWSRLVHHYFPVKLGHQNTTHIPNPHGRKT